VLRIIIAAAVTATPGVLAAPAHADNGYLDRHQMQAVRAFGPGLCNSLDQDPSALTVHNFVQSLIGFKFDDGWYFLEDEAKQVMISSVETYCPQHRDVYLRESFGEGFLKGLLGQ
jgi:hypothetical protein